MIYVNRDRREQGTPVVPPRTWRARAKEATRRAIADGLEHVFDDTIYRDDLVRAALERLFNKKCAYCESYLEETDWDVEHFRPKGRVAENSEHPGYYWLAYSWGNLYPSCKPCNQRRRDRAIWGDLSSRPARGKADQFPLENEATRAWEHGDDLARESTLLIDPCYDKPKWYISFLPDGTPTAINDNCYGLATINVFHLDRRRLTERRKDVVESVCRLLEIEVEIRNESGVKTAKRFRQELETIFASDKSPWAAMARSVLARPQDFGVEGTA